MIHLGLHELVVCLQVAVDGLQFQFVVLSLSPAALGVPAVLEGAAFLLELGLEFLGHVVESSVELANGEGHQLVVGYEHRARRGVVMVVMVWMVVMVVRA